MGNDKMSVERREISRSLLLRWYALASGKNVLNKIFYYEKRFVVCFTSKLSND